MRGGTLSQVKTQSAKICLNFNFFGGGGYSQPSQNSKWKWKRMICLNFKFLGGGRRGYSQPSQNSKCQDLPKFQFFLGGGYSQPSQNSKWKWKRMICLNFKFLGGGRRGYSQPSQNSKCQDLPKFQFSGGGGGTLSQVKTQSGSGRG